MENKSRKMPPTQKVKPIEQGASFGDGSLASYFEKNKAAGRVFVSTTQGVFEIVKPPYPDQPAVVAPLKIEVDYERAQRASLDEIEKGFEHPWSIVELPMKLRTDFSENLKEVLTKKIEKLLEGVFKYK